MVGYTRQSSGGIQDTLTVEASDLNNEYNKLEDAFHATTGHDHSGGTGLGPLLSLTAAVSGVLPIANGGTNAITASAARTSLGVAIGSDVQAWDAQLDDIAALALTDGNIIVGDGTNWVAESGATARTSLGVAIGTNVQAWDAQLDDIAALALTDGNIIVGDGTNWVAESGATARTSLGLAIGTDVQAWDADLDTYASNPLTAAELGELQNIGVVTVSSTQWGYVGGADQALTTTSTPTFTGLNLGSTGLDSTGTISLNNADIAEVNNIRRSLTNSRMKLSGGSTDDLGASVIFNGESTTSTAGDILFEFSGDDLLEWDESEDNWDGMGKAWVNLGAVTMGALTSTGIDDDATSTAITIDSSERVMVNTTTTQTGTSFNDIIIGDTGSTNGMTVRGATAGFGISTTTSAYVAQFKYDGSANEVILSSFGTDPLILQTNNADALTLDSSQNATFAGDITLGGDEILRSVTDDFILVSGGQSKATGAFGQFFGSTHATAAGDIRLGSVNVTQAEYDASDSEWQFLTGGTLALTLDSSQDATFAGDITLPASGTLYGSGTVNSLFVNADSSSGSGSNIILRGSGHANANDMELRSDTTKWLHYDFSATTADFQANDITTTGDFAVNNVTVTGNVLSNNTTSDLALSGGTGTSNGNNLTLYAGSHATLANDARWRAGTTNIMYYDFSATTFDFQANAITTTGIVTAGAGSAAAPSHAMSGDPDTGMYSAGANSIGWSTGGANFMTLAGTQLTVVGGVAVGGFINLGSPTELTIATGVITATASFHTVDTEADAASDDLDTITAATSGDKLLLTPASGSRTVVVKTGTGNILLNASAGDCTMANHSDTLELVFYGSNWRETSRSINNV